MLVNQNCTEEVLNLKPNLISPPKGELMCYLFGFIIFEAQEFEIILIFKKEN